jgi:hypothetical protein
MKRRSDFSSADKPNIFDQLQNPGLRTMAFALGLSALSMGCSTRHWAAVSESELPPPKGERVLHTDKLIVHVRRESPSTQCVAYEKYRPVCFHNIRDAVTKGLVRGLWPAFPEIVVGTPLDADPSDYLLQVDVTLDALPPDDAGPGWSAGARSRYRLIREGKVLAEETIASRSRAQFPYGAPLGEGATEVVDATVLHVAAAVSRVPEERPDKAVPLPQIASRKVSDEARKSAAKKLEETTGQPATRQAKSEK